jgi:surfactin synthase thioesterase subunit
MSGYLTATPRRSADVRLFCFHHAGGGASAFAGWQAELGDAVSVVPIQLPGRESRVREPRVRDMSVLVRELLDELSPWLDDPYVCYGHSMGAFVAHALTRARAHSADTLPRRLVVGAARAPQLPIVLSSAAAMSDQELGSLLASFGGMSPMLLRYPDWLAVATGVVRDDLSLCQTNPCQDIVRLPVALDLFAGAADPMVAAGDVAAWAAHTSVGSRLHVVPGNHFFIRDADPTFFRILRGVLAAATSHSTPSLHR